MSIETSFYRKSDVGIEHVVIDIKDENGDEFDMATLQSLFKETLDKQKEKLIKIVDFGTAVLGDSNKGVSFMFGWVMQKILNTFERKNDSKLSVFSESTVLSSEEIKEQTVEMLTDILTRIKNNDIDINDLPINMTGNDYE